MRIYLSEKYTSYGKAAEKGAAALFFFFFCLVWFCFVLFGLVGILVIRGIQLYGWDMHWESGVWGLSYA